MHLVYAAIVFKTAMPVLLAQIVHDVVLLRFGMQLTLPVMQTVQLSTTVSPVMLLVRVEEITFSVILVQEDTQSVTTYVCLFVETV